MKKSLPSVLSSMVATAIAVLVVNHAARAADTPQWEYVIVASLPGLGLSDPALDRDPVSGALQVAYAIGSIRPSSDTGVYLSTIGGTTKTIVKANDPIPGSANQQFAFVFSAGAVPAPYVSLSQGQVAFKGESSSQTQDGQAILQGLYIGDGTATPRRVVDSTMAIPGNPGARFDSFGPPSLASGHLVFADSTGQGVYGDFGSGLIVIGALDSSLSNLRLQNFTGFGTYPSITATNLGRDFATFLATGTWRGAPVRGIYGREFDGLTPGNWDTYVDTIDNFPYSSSYFGSPSVDFGGAIAFKNAIDPFIPNGMGAIYAGRRSPQLIANSATSVPGAPGTLFGRLGAYPSIDATPRQVGMETTEHAIGFSSEQGVFLAHMANDIAPLTIETVIDFPALGRLLAPLVRINPTTFGPDTLNLFHQAVKDGALAFRVTANPPPASDGHEFIIFARKTTPTLTLLPDADAYVRADLTIRRNDNYGMQDFIEVGTGHADNGQAEGDADKMRAFVHFNVSMLPSLNLTSAALNTTLHSYDNGLPDSVYSVDAHAILAPWVEPKGEGNGYEGPRPPGAPAILTDPASAFGLAWEGQGTSSAPNAANNSSAPAFDPTILSSQTVHQQSNVAGDTFDWDITSLARSWLSKVAPSPNYGVALTDVTGGVFRGLRFGSREGERYALPGAVRGPRLALKWSVGVEPGDLTGDNCVDRDDLAILMAVVRGQAIAGESLAPALDLNGDGKVDIADARKLVTLFSQPLGAPCR